MLNLLLGIVDGGMSAMPTGSNGYWFSKNATNTRLYMVSAINYFNKLDTPNGMKQLYNALGLINGVTVNAYYSFSTTMNATYWNKISADPFAYLQVFSNNVGYMY